MPAPPILRWKEVPDDPRLPARAIPARVRPDGGAGPAIRPSVDPARLPGDRGQPVTPDRGPHARGAGRLWAPGNARVPRGLPEPRCLGPGRRRAVLLRDRGG